MDFSPITTALSDFLGPVTTGILGVALGLALPRIVKRGAIMVLKMIGGWP